MKVSKDEFQQWKGSPVTEEIFEEIQQRIDDAKEILGQSAGLNPEQDRLLCGMILAYNEILNVSMGEV